MRKVILSASILFFAFVVAKAQTPGLIYDPATGGGPAILDPNSDGYTSSSTAGFVSDDQAESELPYSSLAFPETEPTSDLGPGPSCGFTDFVDEGDEDPVQSYLDGSDNWLFRMRMGNTAANSKSYSILIDTDIAFGAIGPNADPNYVVGNPGFEIEIVFASNFGVYIYDVDGTNTPTLMNSYPGHTNYQKSIALTTNCSDPDYFYDFYVPFADLTASFGITTSTPVRMAMVDNMAANTPTIGQTSSYSDIAGVDDEACGNDFETCLGGVIDNYPPTPPNGGPPLDRSDCPEIDAPVLDGGTSVSGTSGEADGTEIHLYVNGTLTDSGTVTGGIWTIAGLAALSTDDTITATATAPGEAASFDNCDLTVVGASCTPTLVDSLVAECTPKKGFYGDPGSSIAGATIRVYDYQGNLVVPNAGSVYAAGAITSNADSSWVWKCNGNNSCSAGANNCITGGTYFVTQEVAGKCESDPVAICIGGAAQTAVPVVTTTPISDTTTIVVGTSVASAEIYFYIDGQLDGTVAATAGGAWTYSGLSLTAGEIITVKAVDAGNCLSDPTADVTVSGTTNPPVVLGTYCTETTIDSVFGFSSEAAGTVIQLYKNAVAEGGTTTVSANGTWYVNSGISFAPGDVITAKATIVGGLESDVSNSVTVLSKTASANIPVITSSPITEGDASVSGTGTNGDDITLYIDGFQIGATTTVAGGLWTIGGLGAFDLYAGGEVTATAASAGKCESDHSAAVKVACIVPDNSLTVNPDDTTVCANSTVANIEIKSSENLVVYQLYNGIATSGSAVLGTGGDITITSGVITSNTTLSVYASKIGIDVCAATLLDSVDVFLNPLPASNLSIYADTNQLCEGDSTTIYIISSEAGFDYQLRDDSDDSSIGSAVAGTGDTLSFSTGPLSTTTAFNFLATGVAPTNCSLELDSILTININALPVVSAGPSQTLSCGTTTTTLAGSDTTGIGVGIWTLDSGTGNFTDNTDSATAVTGIATNSNIYRWTISDGKCSNWDTVSIKTTCPPNSAPVANTDNITVPEDTTNVYIDVQDNDTDPDADALTTTIVSGPNSGGTASVSNNDSILYNPPADFFGADTIIYQVCDPSSACDSDTIFITVTPVNDAPDANTDNVTVNEDTTNVYVDVQANDTDVEGDALTTTILSGPSSGGTASVSNNDSILYSPPANFNGADTIIYQVCDPSSACDSDTIFITVTAVNDVPDANTDSPTVPEDTSNVYIDVQVNDTDIDGDALTTTILSGPSSGGTASVSNNDSILYNPPADYFGADTIIYQVCDPSSACDSDTIFITVTPVNDAPDANTDNVTVNEDTSNVYIDVQANDTDVEGNALTTTILSGPSSGGTASVSNNDSILYTPPVSFNGVDTIIYQVCDPSSACDSDTIFITVSAINNAPDANTDSPTVPEDSTNVYIDVQANDTDPDGDGLTTTIISGPSSGGTTTVVNGDSILYNPPANFNGVDTIIYQICDPSAACDSDTIFITVTPVNDAPDANTDNPNVVEDTSNVYIDVQVNDTDVDGDGLTTTIVSGPSSGGIATVVNGDSILYNPPADFNGVDTIIYQVCDPSAACDIDTIFITVTPENDAPIILDGPGGSSTDTISSTTAYETPVTICIDATDIDGDALDVTGSFGGPSNGSISGTGDNDTCFTYTPNSGFSGTDTVSIIVCDGNGGCDTVVVIITVSPPTPTNQAPIANTDSISIYEDTTNVYIDVQNNDSDPDGDPLTTAIVSGPSSGGSATVVNGDSIIYTPPANFYGTDTIIYTVCDSAGLCDTDTIFITVLPVNDAPVVTSGNGTNINNDTLGVSTPLETAIQICFDGTDIDSNLFDASGVISGPSNGTVSGIGDNDTCFTYTPGTGFIGTDTVVVVFCDDGVPSLCDTVTIYIHVGPVPPIAVNDTVNLDTSSIDILVKQNDTDPQGDTLIITITTDPVNGTATNSAGVITYTPSFGFCGLDSFQYRACNSYGLCDDAWVYVNVIPTDSDGDGIPDYVETLTDDTDGDGTPDYLSTDSDGDGISDTDEAGDLSDPCNITLKDTDGDGIPDVKDPDYELMIPEGFSPNNDGVNDLLEIQGLDEYPEHAIIIFNRWGNKVFYSKPYHNDWNGTNQYGVSMGEELPEGTYFYVLDLGDGEKVKGYIYITR